MKRLFVAAMLLIVSAGSWASEPLISETMAGYWQEYSHGNFSKAATYMDPRDLKELRDGLVPLFLAATDHSNEEVRKIVNSFFNGVPDESRKEMSAEQVFAGLSQVGKQQLPEVFETLATTRIEVTEVRMGTTDSATVHYTVITPEGNGQDNERASLHDGKWYLRIKEPPQETIKKLRSLLGQ
ncbi:MAG: hypothetical protein WD944_12430 [Steroidobacteraceae bacterium]